MCEPGRAATQQVSVAVVPAHLQARKPAAFDAELLKLTLLDYLWCPGPGGGLG